MANRSLLKLKQRFLDLMADPFKYFNGSVRLTLFPNGDQNEIWIQDKRGFGVAVKAGAGPYGITVTISKFPGGNPITLHTAEYQTWKPSTANGDFQEVTTTIYYSDLASRQFKLWYKHDTRRRGIPHPSERMLTVEEIVRIEEGEDPEVVLGKVDQEPA